MIDKLKPTAEFLKIQEEQKLKEYAGPDRVMSSHDIKELVAKLKPSFNFKANLKCLDTLIDGFEGGELVILTGYTGHGKSTLAQALTVSLADQNINSLWFTFEVTPTHFFSKFPDKTPLFYMPVSNKGHNLDWIRERIIEGKIKYGIKAVFIDHLHYVVDLSSDHPSLEIGSILRRMKTMCLDLNITTFLIAHTSMPKNEKMPGLGDIRDSSFIGQEADMVLAVHRAAKEGSKEYGDESWIKVLKNRRLGRINNKVKILYRDKRFYDYQDYLDKNLTV